MTMETTPARRFSVVEPALVAVLVASCFTLAVTVLPFLGFAYRSTAAHAAIETVAAMAALVAAALVFWRFRRSAALSDLLLLCALGVLAASGFAFTLGPTIFANPGEPFFTWSSVVIRLVAAGLLAAAALMPEREIPVSEEAARWVVAVVVGVLILVAVGVAVVAEQLPEAIDPSISPESSSRTRIVGEPGVLGVQATSAILYVLAAAGFARRAERWGDEFLGWVAVASIFGAFARVNYFLFPSLYSEWVYTGDILRVAFYATLLYGAWREIAGYHSATVEKAALEERRQVARNLHDGLAQELTLLLDEARTVEADPQDRSRVRHLTVSAERALDDAREAIGALTRTVDEPLDVAVARAAQRVATRRGARLRLDVDPDVEVPDGMRDDLVRIVREAVTNATRHGGAKTVDVRLRVDGDIRLVIADDGSGFDVEAAEHGDGFGLTSMRERAERLGGTLAVSSSAGQGCRVEAVLPWPT